MQTMNDEPQEVRASVLNAALVGAVSVAVLRFDTILNKSLTPAAGTPPNIRAATTANNGTIWTVNRRGHYLSILSVPVLEVARGLTFAISLNATNLNAIPVLNAGGMVKTTAVVIAALTQAPMELKFGIDVYDSDLVVAGNIAQIRFHAFGNDEVPVAISELVLALGQAQVIYMGDTRG